MIHDIDLAMALDPSTARVVRAEGAVSEGPFIDEARAELAFGGGMTVVLEASRCAPARERTMRIVYPSGEVEIDFLARTFRNATPFALDPDFADSPEGRDPLGASVVQFVAAARGLAPRPLVTGEEAARALDLALAVDRAALPSRESLRR